MEIATFRHWNSETDQVQYEIPAELIRRPSQFNTSGKAITVGINSYPITQFPRATVYQYDVSWVARTALSSTPPLYQYPRTDYHRRFTLEAGSRSVASSVLSGPPRRFSKLLELAGFLTATRSLGALPKFPEGFRTLADTATGP